MSGPVSFNTDPFGSEKKLSPGTTEDSTSIDSEGIDPLAGTESSSSQPDTPDSNQAVQPGVALAGRAPSFAESYISGMSAGSGLTKTATSRASKAYTHSAKSGQTGRSGQTQTQNQRAVFKSTRLKGDVYKPWVENPDRAQFWARFIIFGCIALGLGLGGILCWDGYRVVPQMGKICLVLEDQFDTLDTSIWHHDLRVGGFRNGEFEWDTNATENSFVEDNVLYIVPTLTSDVLSDAQIQNGYTLDLGSTGACTAANLTGPNCLITSNSTAGTIIPPVRSARITTELSKNIRYGKIEFEAKMPTGDWIWPSIWMSPVEDYYGSWPASGEIDIVQGRGNGASYPTRGVDYISSALHWGVWTALDRTYWTWGWNQQRRKYYNKGFRTFGLEWTDKYIMTYVDSRVQQTIHYDLSSESFWDRAQYPSVVKNDSTDVTVTNPWAKSNNNSAPFDRAFYLVIEVAVGGTSGWFPDSEGDKPWIDTSLTAPYDFYNATSTWYPTWPSDPKERGLAVKNLKMWQKC
ncbi:Glycoside hydrolase, family 16 [Phaffia rhodozyma]|uniref:Glycoside hydrolase, family 16 n=1 Tax=Phaffia rhodozyma TaxID=264483 RepID=A0A0F7SR47_PHARH|nr:Glycoside hydrolase, family 16 [Phaffia rhodozyma]